MTVVCSPEPPVSGNPRMDSVGALTVDVETAPQLMVNGSNFAGPSGGDMSTVTAPPTICGANAPAAQYGVTAQSGEEFALRDLMLKAGITLPPGRGQGLEDRYVYLDTNGNPQEVQICFQWNKPKTASGSGNIMVLTGLTPDLARALDQAIDGKPDAALETTYWRDDEQIARNVQPVQVDSLMMTSRAVASCSMAARASRCRRRARCCARRPRCKT